MVYETGSLIFNVAGQAVTTNTSLSQFGAFVENYPPCFGALVPGTMEGPMYTEGAWEFMTGGAYTLPIRSVKLSLTLIFGLEARVFSLPPPRTPTAAKP